MKKFIQLITVMIIVASIIKCSNKRPDFKQDTTDQALLTSTKKALTRVDDPNSLTHDQIMLFRPESQKSLFRTMNSKIKASIWLDRIVYATSFFRASIKKEKLLELKAFITPAFYSTESPSKVEEKKITNWIAENLQLFGVDNLRLILTTLNELKLINSETETLGENIAMSNPCPPCDMGPDNPCTCSTSSDWCSGSNVCGTGYNCTQVSGCGTFWAYTCNGKCGMW